MHDKTPTNAAEELTRLRVDSDTLDIDAGGSLTIDGVAADTLLREFGSPLYVISETTLRRNIRDVFRAFGSRWPQPVNVMYAIKANNNLAVRAIVHAEGGGGDCFGAGELHATFLAGADPARIAMNGSLKSEQEIGAALDRGVTINIDAEDEIDKIAAAARTRGVRARVNLRLKVTNDAFRTVGSDYFGVSEAEGLHDRMVASKWGFSLDAAAALVRRMAGMPELHHAGFSWHVGRFSNHPEPIGILYRTLGEMVVALHARTGYWPEILDIGGGIPRRREPESRSGALNPLDLDGFAGIVCSALLRALETAGRPIPALWMEPGRYIIGNAGVLLATVGTVKRDLGHVWVNLDASTNQLMRIETSGSHYHVLPATGMRRPYEEEASVVGVTCIPSVFAASRQLPILAPGDAVAMLDTGMYSETASTQFNGLPRPATVLVNQGTAELIKLRETVEDVFRLHRIPDRLRSAG